MTDHQESVVLDWDPGDLGSVRDACRTARDQFGLLRAEVGRVIVGQQKVVDETLVALFAGGHVLLEGVPGLGKTLLVQTIAQALDLEFARIQFTPDVMPADITGTTIVMEHESNHQREIVFRPGPIFHQLVLADEVCGCPRVDQARLRNPCRRRHLIPCTHQASVPAPNSVIAAPAVDPPALPFPVNPPSSAPDKDEEEELVLASPRSGLLFAPIVLFS